MNVFRGRISGQVTYLTNADVTIHCPSNPIPVVNNYEIVAITRQHTLAAM